MYVFSLLKSADVSLLTSPWNRQDETLFDDDDSSTLYISFHQHHDSLRHDDLLQRCSQHAPRMVCEQPTG